MLARTNKDLWEETVDPALKLQYLLRAEALYRESFAGGPDTRYWSGINAATLQLLLGQAQAAQTTARAVQKICSGALQSTSGSTDRYWLEATLGEAALVLDQLEVAGVHYSAAAALAAGDLGNLASTRRNARLILRALGHDPQLLEQWLPSPAVVVFTGHLIDAADPGPAPLSSEQRGRRIRSAQAGPCRSCGSRSDSPLPPAVPTSCFWRRCWSSVARSTSCCPAISSRSRRTA